MNHIVNRQKVSAVGFAGKRKHAIHRAISIRQPYVELILQGKKKFEYRSQPTNIRERVYLYASKKLGGDENDWHRVQSEPEPPAHRCDRRLSRDQRVRTRDDNEDWFAYALAKP